MTRRFVIDTNIIISSVLSPKSKPNTAFKKAQQLGIIIVSSATWQELESVLSRPKFGRYISLEERQQFLLDFSETVEFILNMEFRTDICRDTKDNKYLELAVNGQAESIITGDQDLLILHPFLSINIVTVNDFWLFSTLCDNFCLCKVKCLLGKTFRTILKEETISIDLVYTQKPEEPIFYSTSKLIRALRFVLCNGRGL
ncbi:hypothetical protein VL20_1149 [Microcystis panniformis FACHB-1757]|uniref:PIN domain-containing protein n=1 Tax=Microcystis panniformis FACHB-1757 TaxID=1638788 RepID=A0A0K1RX00_9CHRO|nr:hypothetical protein VL20_1149 [Microcystis panniformis FACHB-1757]